MTDILSRLTASLADRYRIERELGAGGMATVYLAHDVRHDRKVALKVLRPELSAILGGDRFLKEIRLTANLQHPHILPLHDSGEAVGVVFYVMPYVEGESLRDRLMREKQLPVDEAVRIAREIADALDYAHRHGVVHRDIKPENILLHDGRVQVADFGIALAVSTAGGSTRMTETGMSLGTPHYMAPEQAMGEREITPKADIYALGCVLYEMLTAEPPFTGATAQAIIARVMTEEPRSLTMQRRTIPPNVEATVRKALEKLPADRFATAAEFNAALANTGFVGTGTSAFATPAGYGPRAPQTAPRASVIVPWLLFLAAAGALAWQLTRPVPPPPGARRQRVVLRAAPFAPGGLARLVAIAPDGNTIVFYDTVGGVRQLWAKERGLLEAAPLAGTVVAGQSAAAGPVFSPDGAWIAFVGDGKLKKVPRLGGSAITLADSANNLYPAIAWLDNDSVVFNRTTYALALVGANGGPAREVISIDSGFGAVGASPLPGGRAALVTVCRPGCNEVELRAVALDGRPSRVLAGEAVRGWHIGDGQVLFVRQDGGVFVAPFALDSLAFTAPPTPVLDGVRSIAGRADLVLGSDGTLLYVAGGATLEGTIYEAVWVGRDGAVTPIEPGWSFAPSTDFSFALAPDGRRLAVSVRGGEGMDIWIKSLDPGPFTRLTFDGVNIRPSWTADGRMVMYASRHTGEIGYRVRARRADGTGGETTLVANARSVFEIVRLRDTTRLLVRYTAPPSRDLFAARIGDSTLVSVLVNPDHDEVQPALSPDERWLAYGSNESGRMEIYVRPFPNVDTGRWQVSRNGGTEPVWAPGGRELFYRDREGNLVSVAVTPRGSFEPGAQRVLFSARAFFSGGNHQQYAVTPDGRRFVFSRAVGGSEAEAPAALVVQVDNWLAELRQRRAAAVASRP